MRRKKRNSYNDGIVKFYKKKNVEKNVKSLDDLEYLGFLYFEEKSKRQQDYEFAEQHGAKLSMKIATPDDGSMDTYGNAVIGDGIYAIINADRNKEKQELYFYLEEIRKIER